MSLEPRDTPQGIVGIAFARALVAGEYEVAYNMLSATLQAALPLAQLREQYESMIEPMIEDGGNPPYVEDVITILDDWPTKEFADIGWAYVAIGGDVYSEAVSVLVMQEHTKHVIREIQWGRP